jgi:hypothetical protein
MDNTTNNNPAVVTKHMPPFVFVQGATQFNFSQPEELLNL